MVVSELVRAELRRVDWASLECGCGDSAEHVPLLIEAIITAETPRDMIGYTLDGHIEVNTITFECTPHAVGVIMAALAGELSVLARGVLLETLLFVAAGSDDYAPHAEGAGPGDGCRHHAQEGFWKLVQIGLTGSADDAETVADICEYFGLGGDKAAFYQAQLRERMRAKTKRGRST
ncbi:hypothetical protein NMG29_30705 [Streptomyces cocklensis]|uniref:Uncharacterized protein n=1 Tax=Actinacidiphila cocklensis TaxID=887465 RepID=A0A9W4GP00_9ACTN|nr:hypothetical protein [Actinacidiphila cocklensis]MDD1062529.1 hypothetical protein [Actinacidiphila cocklensis]WSX72456.1 hypothetical protein OH826_00355 [Streptomyces sp. NBC_00899]WSX81474.1 hypothetical protein OH826_51140 [Streptomyces sp. NBC_00899]CAG6391920.1 conserved hypothetical protein [Actinacidiphila cocklensis]